MFVLDIAGAFDRVWHHGLITKLISFGVRDHLFLLLQHYLRGRYVRVVMNGETSNEHPNSSSVPQRSVHGPLLRNAFFNDSFQRHEHTPMIVPCLSPATVVATARLSNMSTRSYKPWSYGDADGKWNLLVRTQRCCWSFEDAVPLTFPSSPSCLMWGRCPYRLPSPY